MTKTLNNIILLSIFVVPMASIIPMRGTIIWYPQLLALMCIGFVCLAMLFWNTNKFISIFLIYTTFSYLFICSQSPRAMLCLITGYAGIMFSYFVSQSDTSKIYKVLALFAMLNAFLVILQIFKLDPIFSQTSNWVLDRTVGFMGSRNQLGIFHAGSSVLLMSISPWFLLLSLPILLVKCSSAFAGLIAGIISYLFFTGKRLLATLLILLVLALIPLLLYFKGNLIAELKERVQVWTLTINQTINGKMDLYDSEEGSVTLSNHRVVKFNPLFGAGIGNFFVFSPSSQVGFNFSPWHRYEHAHNDFVEGFLEFGYAGLALMLLCISSVISNFLSCINKTKGLIRTFSALVSLAVCSLGVYVFHAPVSFFLFCLTLGLFYRELKNAKQSQIT